MINYSHEEGLEFFQSLDLSAEQGVTFAINPKQELIISLVALGIRPPGEEVIRMFNSAIPNMHIQVDEFDSHLVRTNFSLTVNAKLVQAESEGFKPLERAEAVGYCLTQALHFISVLGMSSKGVLTWNEMDLTPSNVAFKEEGEEVEVDFQNLVKRIAPGFDLHAGHFRLAVEMLGYLAVNNWPERFFRLYERGMMLTASPDLPFLRFREEAYQCFYKCLEYTVMAKILDKRGQYKSIYFPHALKALGLKPADGADPFTSGKASADYLSKERHTAVAHFVKGCEEVELNFEKIVHLKHVVDNLVSRAVMRNFTGSN